MCDDKSPIFIVGAPRSGTHLLRYCLNQHSEIYILPETRFFFGIYGNRNLMLKGVRHYSKWISKQIFNSGDPSMEDFVDSKKDLLEKLNNKNIKNFKDILNVIMEVFGHNKNKVRFGEKTPNHLFFVNHIHKLFPDAKILFVKRNIKNVMASYLKSSHMPSDFIRALAHNINCNKAFEKASEKGMIINYEELTHHAEKVLKDVCNYINIDFQEEMLKPKMMDSSYGKTVMEFNKDIGIVPENEDKWKTVLSNNQSNIIDYYFTANSKNTPSIILRIKIKVSTFLYELRVLKNYLGFENILRGFI